MVVAPRTFTARLVDYGQLFKLRLASLVVLSAALAFLIGSTTVDYTKLWLLVLGGFLVTGSSNGLNQIYERRTDKIMKRTRLRPLPDSRMSLTESLIVTISAGVIGLFILTYYINLYSGILGFIALVSYAFAYTPLKGVTPLSVFVGAFPGAIPTLLGWVAATGQFSYQGWILFAIQFMWQFPHFWAIAWVMDHDYKKAGFKLLPSGGGRDKSSAFQILIYTLLLLPISLMPIILRMAGPIAAVVIIILGLFLIAQTIKLYRKCDIKSAQQLMFGSFIYLPVMQLALIFDKI